MKALVVFCLLFPATLIAQSNRFSLDIYILDTNLIERDSCVASIWLGGDVLFATDKSYFTYDFEPNKEYELLVQHKGLISKYLIINTKMDKGISCHDNVGVIMDYSLKDYPDYNGEKMLVGMLWVSNKTGKIMMKGKIDN